MSVIHDTLTTTCRNCEVTFDGKFCPNCSQKADTHRFTLGHFAHEFFHALTHTDKGILFLIKALFRSPGKVALEYNAGKRKKYFNPITFLLIMTALQVFLASKTGFFTHFTEFIHTGVQEMVVKPEMSSAELQNIDKRLDEADKQMMMITENNKLLTLLFIPLLALFTWLFFKRSGHNYAENLVFNILVGGQLMVFFVLFAIIPFLIKPSLIILWFALYYVVMWIYSFIAYKQFFGQRWGITILKGLVLQILYMALVQNATTFLFSFLKK